MKFSLTVVLLVLLVAGLSFGQHTYVLPGYTPSVGTEDGWIPDDEGTATSLGLAGTASETFAQTTQTSAMNWWSGIYDWGDGEWINIEGEPDATSIYVRCDIEMYVKQIHDANEIYFHIADNITHLSAIINGTISSNNGQYIGIEIPENKDITKLVGTVDIGNRDITSQTIPVTWELREYDPNSQTWTAWRTGDDTYGNGGKDHAIWWLIAGGDPCDHTYQFRCSIDPAYHQPDGRYELDPALAIAPIL